FLSLLCFHYSVGACDLHSFPTRRSSDLGRSSIRPIKDFVGFISLVTRLSIYFNPLKVFTPLALFLLALSFVILSLGYFYTGQVLDRKSTRLNSSHVKISYAVFCLKKTIR